MHGVIVAGFNFLIEEASFIILCLRNSCKYKQSKWQHIIFVYVNPFSPEY
jgi:hypothetical protein